MEKANFKLITSRVTLAIQNIEASSEIIRWWRGDKGITNAKGKANGFLRPHQIIGKIFF
jgi:hypothetical protein